MMFHNTEKTETCHGNVPQVLFVAIIKFFYSWLNKCDVTRLRHKY